MPDDSNMIRLADRRKGDPEALAALVPDEDLFVAARGCLRLAHQDARNPDRQKQSRLAVEIARHCLDRLLTLGPMPDAVRTVEQVAAQYDAEQEFLDAYRSIADGPTRKALQEVLARVKNGVGPETLAELVAWVEHRAARISQEAQ